jgi:hypothetical protein
MACRRLGTRLAEYTAYAVQGRQDCHPLKASKANDLARWGYPGIPPRDADPKELVALNQKPHGPVAPAAATPKAQLSAAAGATPGLKSHRPPTPVAGKAAVVVAALAGVALGVALSSLRKK